MERRARPSSVCAVLVRFEPIRLSAHDGGEEACLVLANDHLVAVLVRLVGEEGEPAQNGWFLETGFDPCNREGLIFSSLDAVEGWLRAQIPERWAEATATRCI